MACSTSLHESLLRPPPAPVPQEPKRRGGRDFFHSLIWLTLAAGVGFQCGLIASLRNEISVQNAQVARLESWLGKDANSMTCQDTALSKQHNQFESQADQPQELKSRLGEMKVSLGEQEDHEEALEVKVGSKRRKTEITLARPLQQQRRECRSPRES